MDAAAEDRIIRKARKQHRCVTASLAERGTRPDVSAVCKRVIKPGEQYVEGDTNPYKAGGFGHDRICMPCAKAGFA